MLILEAVEKPGNLGAMVRTAAAMGCAAVLVVGRCGDPWAAAALRNSTGAVYRMPILAFSDPAAAAAWASSAGLALLAAVLGDALAPSVPLPTAAAAGALAGDVAVVIGSESSGLSRVWREAADVRVEVPMPGALPESGGVDSLNAGVAAGILLYAVAAAEAA